MFEKQLLFGYFAISLKIFIIPRFFIISGESEQRDMWRQHCNGKNLVIIQNDPCKQVHLPPSSSEKCGVFFPTRCLGRGAAQIFVVMPTSIFLSGRSASYGLEICLWIFEETVTRVCTLNISGLQVILLSLNLGLSFSKIC